MDRGWIQRFQIVGELGVGGRGTVYRAHDPQLARDVAIKLLLAAAEPRDDTWTRTVDLRAPSNDELLTEARAMAQLAHPNVLPVFEVGVHEGAVFLVMELVEGTDLRTWLDGAPTRAAILDVFAQAGRGLAAAHARGVVHRDFKPENVLVGSDGRVRVADFGLSNIDPRQDTLRRVADASGTPEYMAPELARERASPASDVFAFAVSLAEALLGRRPDVLRPDVLAAALRDAAVAPPLVAAIVAGVADDPTARPRLAGLVEMLAGDEPRARRHWRRTLAVALAVAVGAAGVAYVAWPDAAAPTCVPDRRLLDNHWSAARRAALVRAHGDAARDMIAALDRHAAQVVTEQQRACQASVHGEVADAQLRMWRGCLDRRAITIGALAERVAKEKTTGSEIAARLVFVPSCADISAPPSTDLDRFATLALRNLLVGISPRAGRTAAYEEIEREADAVGEVELSIVSELYRGQTLQATDQLEAADGVWKRAHERAMKIHAFDLAANVLIARAALAMSRNDTSGARALSDLALQLADRRTVSPLAHAGALETTARVEFKLGNYGKAVAGFDKARTALIGSGTSARGEMAMRMNQVRALIFGGRKPEALVLARETVDFARTRIGETSSDLGDALDVLGLALRHNGKIAEGVEARKQALAILSKRFPPEHSSVMQVRATLATELAAAGDYKTARDELRIAIAATEKNEGLRPRYAFYLRALGETELNLGNHAEAMRILQRAVDEVTSALGQDHLATTHALRQYIDYALELERFDDAEAALERIRRAFRNRPPEDKGELLSLEGTYGAMLALDRGRAREAAAAARKGLAALAELKLDRSEDAAWMQNVLAKALVAARAWRPALAAAETALAIGRAQEMREDYLALFSLPFAQAAFALGKKDEARAAVASAREVLARYPGQPRGRSLAAKLTRP